jgi:hypothetical protein
MKIFAAALAVLLAFAFAACGEGGSGGNTVGTGKVTFVNLSSYRVNVRLDSFSGIIVAELGSGTDITRTIDIQTNSPHGLGTVFEIEYLVTPLLDGNLQMASDGGEISAGVFDPDVRFSNVMIQENKSITLQIRQPQPANLYVRCAFMTIQNNNEIPATLVRGSSVYQAGNNRLIPIAQFRTGIYRLNNLALLDIPIGEEVEFSGLHIRVGQNTFPLPVFTARNGYIYCFIFNGNSVTRFCRGAHQPPCAGHTFVF